MVCPPRQAALLPKLLPLPFPVAPQMPSQPSRPVRRVLSPRVLAAESLRAAPPLTMAAHPSVCCQVARVAFFSPHPHTVL
ncbi:hypothetical protein K504DRAFT_456695 [Pleomassaria siparia CBS 279.74]|uniref:Uncharacterized protein n=1 Tax=Pleomassaria siparia CBS 279.74 TaxID=1314801 RepID=A0A6G1KNJ3_9PLEO|nr:hypothetical protein K504DRAFT_456695 [Pleomassaria siparia CBS 279.74]